MKRIVIAGGSGFLGQVIQRELQNEYEVFILTRNKKLTSERNYFYWNGMDHEDLNPLIGGAFAVINLSGKSVDCRYNERNKKEIFSSRLNATNAIGKAIMACKVKPEVWINSASATIYRHAEDRPMTEENGEKGSGFSVEVSKAWEHTFFSYKLTGTRQVAIRTAIVLGKNGGVMKPFKNLARFGIGGHMGNGNQMFSWMHESDFAAAIKWILNNNELNGVINLSAPNPIPNKVFMKQLRREMHVGFGIPTPKWLLEAGAILIKTETELILKSRWVLPEKLLKSGFEFRYPEIQMALRELLT